MRRPDLFNQFSYQKNDSEAEVAGNSYRRDGLQDLDPLDFEEKTDLSGRLKQRHIQMIALCGTIGTGLFFDSGRIIVDGGPAGAFLGYLIVGLIVICVVLTLAELTALVPLSGGIIRPAEYLFDPALAFAQGWNSVYGNAITVPADLAATAVIISFWKEINNGLWITLFGLLLLASNFLLVKVSGEVAFSFAQLKIILIIGLILMGLCLSGGAGPSNQIKSAQYWRPPNGPFVQFFDIPGSSGRFLSFWSAISNAIFSYGGIESFCVAAAETKSPRRNIPKAAKRLLLRVISLYLVSILIITLLVPSSDPALLTSSGTATASPFTIAASRAGVKVVPHIINAVVLTSAWSAANTAYLVATRTLYGLSLEGHAPRAFQWVNRYGVPYVSVSFVGAFICLAYMTLSTSAAEVFTWFSDLVAASDMVHWIVICFVYLRFYYGCKRRGINRDLLPYKSPFQPYLSWIGLLSVSLILLTGGFPVFIKGHWSAQDFVSSYFNIPLIFMLYFGYKFARRTKIVTLDKIPIQHYIDIANANPEQPERPAKGWQKMAILWS